jgi:DNA-binding beta-propeller fold protein YncE
MTIPLDQPNGILFNKAQTMLYVANFGSNQVLIYNVNNPGKHNVSLSQVGSITERINGPTRLAFDLDGNLYVTNVGDNNVTIFNSTGKLIYTIHGREILRPLGVAVGKNYHVYVANSAYNTITKYDPNSAGDPAAGFTLDSVLTGDGDGNQFLAPGVLMFDIFGDPSLGLFVGLGPTTSADSVLYYKSLPLSSGSAPQGKLTNAGCPTNPTGPTGICVDDQNSLVYVSSYYNSSISAYTVQQFEHRACLPSHELLHTSLGNNQSGIAYPEGVALDGENDLFVSNSSKSTITVYLKAELHGPPANTFR